MDNEPLNGDLAPAEARWDGPLYEFHETRLGEVRGS